MRQKPQLRWLLWVKVMSSKGEVWEWLGRIKMAVRRWHLWQQTSDNFQDLWTALHCCFPKLSWSSLELHPKLWLVFFPFPLNLRSNCWSSDPVCLCVSDAERLPSLSIFLKFECLDFNSQGRAQCDVLILPSLLMSKQAFPFTLACSSWKWSLLLLRPLHMLRICPNREDTNPGRGAWAYS